MRFNSHRPDMKIFQGQKYWVSPLTLQQSRLLHLSILPWLISVVAFVLWWIRPEHHISLLGSVIGSIIILFEILTPGYFYYFIRRIKIVNPCIVPCAEWRLAIVVTRAPSEPWEIVQKNLIAMLEQDIPHDTWLADEQPTKEILEWCSSNNVFVSTRYQVAEYHQRDWPRRTRCKEGNLAYFYDMYGYERYDFVAQLDADHIPNKNYLREIVRPFVDPSVGYVAAPSICDANAAESWSARGRLYAEATLHGPLQSGYNDKWAPLCIGSHYCVRTKALKDIGGLGPELAEDHSTTLLMNASGWNGVFQPSAIAHGDGPATFVDCMIQEYQWSRSLAMILLRYTPSYFGGLSPRKRLQFLFSQTWYTLFSSVAIVGYLLPLVCLAIDNPMLRVTYLDFLGFTILVSLSNFIPTSLLKRYKMLRPDNAKLFSWEYLLFTLTRFPWVFSGVIHGVAMHITGKDLDFRVTPKGADMRPALPTRMLAPYFLISLLSSILVLLLRDRDVAAGFYFLALISALWMWLSAAAITWLHYKEGAIPSFYNIFRALFWLSLSAVLLLISGLHRLSSSAAVLFNIYTDGPSRFIQSNINAITSGPTAMNKVKYNNKTCRPAPCFGYYDYSGSLTEQRVPAAIKLAFIPWGKRHSKEIKSFINQSARDGVIPIVTLEPWPWAVLSLEPRSTYKEREAAANKMLLKSISNGFYDAELKSSLEALSGPADAPVIIRVMHEMEATKQYPWFNEDPKLFISAYKHIVNLARDMNLKNLQWMWSPVGFVQADKYWPGSEYVDFVGLSIYATPEWNGGFVPKGANLSMDMLLKARYWVRKYDKPIILAEVGINDIPPRRINWLKDAFRSLPYFPEVVGWVYFNQQQPPVITLPFGLPDWSLSPGEASELKSLLQDLGNSTKPIQAAPNSNSPHMSQNLLQPPPHPKPILLR